MTYDLLPATLLAPSRAKPYNWFQHMLAESPMQVMINGEWQEQPEPVTLAELLQRLALEPRRVAVELNKRLVPRSRHAETSLADRDELEIVTLVGGG
jgi:sulfur carrier protein